MIKVFFIIIAMLSFTAQASNIKTVESQIINEIFKSAENIDPENKIEINIIKGRDKISADHVEKLELTNLKLDEERQFFEGFLKINEVISEEISGRFTEYVKVPAVKRKLRRNEVIEEKDISYVDLDKSRLSRGYILDEYDLIGKSPTRTLFRNRPILQKQVGAPQIIERRQSVTMVFENDSITIQDIGTALEDGALGDVIKVRNTNSNVIVHGVIIAENTISVNKVNRNIASNF